MAKHSLLRIKRKLSDEPLEALYIESWSRPEKVKRQQLELQLGKLSLSNETGLEGLSTGVIASKKQKYRLVDTLEIKKAENLASSEDLLKAVQGNERKKNSVTENSVPRSREGNVGQLKPAKYRRVNRKRIPMAEGSSSEPSEPADFLDLVKVEVEEDVVKNERREKSKREAAFKEGTILCNFLPLLQRHDPQGAKEVERAIEESKIEFVSNTNQGKEEEKYVYDLYCMEEMSEFDPEEDKKEIAAIHIFDDDDFDESFDFESDMDSEDSNAENRPENDYPEEEIDEEVSDEEEAAMRKEMRKADGFFSDGDDINPFSDDSEEYDAVAFDEVEFDSENEGAHGPQNGF